MLKVKPEGREGVFLVEKEDLKEWLVQSGLKKIHNFCGSSQFVLGADHNLESVLKDVDKAERIAVLTGGSKANNMGHGLAMIIKNKLEMYDIGELPESELQLVEKEGK